MSDFVAAESAIRQLQARYIDAVWRKDTEAYADCWAEDGEWRIVGANYSGRKDIAAAFAHFMRDMDRNIQYYGTPIIELGQGSATGRTFVTELCKYKDGRRCITLGTYYDRFVEQGSRWRFAFRRFDLYYLGPSDLSAPFFTIPDFGLPPGVPDAGQPASPSFEEYSKVVSVAGAAS